MADESVGDRISHRFREASRWVWGDWVHDLIFQQIQGGQQMGIFGLHAFVERSSWLPGSPED
jgi:hypothetical protein